MSAPLRVRHTVTFLEEPLMVVDNLPGCCAELRPDAARALAAALLRAADDCEALLRDARRYGPQRREYAMPMGQTRIADAPLELRARVQHIVDTESDPELLACAAELLDLMHAGKPGTRAYFGQGSHPRLEGRMVYLPLNPHARPGTGGSTPAQADTAGGFRTDAPIYGERS